jgi:hypothetical protein
MKFIWSNNRTSSTPLQSKTLHRHLPKEWRQTHEERQNWHSFRMEQARRRQEHTPLVRLDSVLTTLGQAV